MPSSLHPSCPTYCCLVVFNSASETENAFTVHCMCQRITSCLVFLAFFPRSRHALPGELVLVWGDGLGEGFRLQGGSGRCTWHCGKRAIIRLLPPPAVVLCSCRASSTGVLCVHASLLFFFFFCSRLTATLVPRSTPVRTIARHNTSFLFRMLREERQRCLFFFSFFCVCAWVGVGVCLFPCLHTRKTAVAS